MALKNTLEDGRSRIGLMVDGLPETPRVAVKLERSGRQVELTIPFLEGSTDIYWYWFAGDGVGFADDPAKTKRRYEPPESVSFYDSSGPVGLVGSRVSGSSMNYGGAGVGEGRLSFDYTILGARSGAYYEMVNGLRSEVEGLGTWIGLRSLAANREFKDGRLAEVNLRLKSTPPIRAARTLNAEFQPNWRTDPGPGPDQTTITERMQIHTQVKRPASWAEHFRVHSSTRDLLRVAAWRRLNFVNHEVMSVRDPIRTLDGKAHGQQWFPVITNMTGISQSTTGLDKDEFLFTYDDVGSRGVRRWLELQRNFERGLSSLVGLLEIVGASLEAHISQVGIAFEMLGYDLAVEAGSSKAKAKDLGFSGRVEAVSSAVGDVLPFSAEQFHTVLRQNYVAVKHAERNRPAHQQMYLVYLQAIQVFRAWVALRLGVPKVRLKAALERDPLTRRLSATQRHLDGPSRSVEV